MNKDLLVICPTRERPESCARMIQSFDKKSSNRAQLIFIIDSDDRWFHEYEYMFARTHHSFIVRHQNSICETYNMIVTQWYPDYKFYSVTCDDYIYHTGNWDQVLMKKLIEKSGGFAYGDDGMNGPNLPTTCIISGEIVRALGWIVLPGLKCLCGDLVWRELGNALNRLFYIPEVKIEHMSCMAGKAEEDDTYRHTNSPENYTNDNKTFRTWRSNKMPADAAKIQGALS